MTMAPAKLIKNYQIQFTTNGVKRQFIKYNYNNKSQSNQQLLIKFLKSTSLLTVYNKTQLQ